MTTPRTPIRNDDVSDPKGLQRPINEAIRSIATQLDALPRRDQVWLQVTLPAAGQVIRAPEYQYSGVLVLAALDASTGITAVTGAPWISVTQGQTDAQQFARIDALYGVATSGVIDLLVEFVEDLTPRRARDVGTTLGVGNG
jgi:hypothetical protein